LIDIRFICTKMLSIHRRISLDRMYRCVFHQSAMIRNYWAKTPVINMIQSPINFRLQNRLLRRVVSTWMRIAQDKSL